MLPDPMRSEPGSWIPALEGMTMRAPGELPVISRVIGVDDKDVQVGLRHSCEFPVIPVQAGIHWVAVVFGVLIARAFVVASVRPRILPVLFRGRVLSAFASAPESSNRQERRRVRLPGPSMMPGSLGASTLVRALDGGR